MRRIIEAFAFMLIVLSSGAFIQQMKDGGARDQGLENTLNYSGPLNALPLIWAAGVLFIVSILFITKNLKRIKFSWPLMVLIGFCFLSVLWADQSRISFRSALLIATAYLLINTQISLYGGPATLRFLSLAFFVILACSLVAVLLVPSYGMAAGTEHAGKWQGVFDHKNGLGNFAAIAALIFSWQYFRKKSKINFIKLLLAIILVIGSQSGTAVANSGVIVFIIAILNLKFVEKIVYKLRYIIISFLIFLSFFAIYIAIGFQEFSIFEKDSSFTGRNLIWSYILAKVAASPWIGYGLDQLGALTNKNSAEFFTNVGFLVGSSHNGFLETAFSLGCIGLLLTLWVLMSQLSRKNEGADFTLLFSYLISFVVVNTFEAQMISFNFYFVGLMYVIAVTGSMASSSAKVSRKNKSMYQLSIPDGVGISINRNPDSISDNK